ncbi:hypothetical protein ED312_10235 [Sinomicrobium pectinilyticum]|uniref:Uncharacterized protein n=1 Tax=Sinomicrobium pectinilyticum TaxID=1084421 RepID=A0A3N0EH75_SINP1|nr:hypothetical protein [Sinomicrobium pectinilyticum]RNL87182.1 hypothetical protein ED312_10235 [Sinomicrobium pectinilyticum]
MGTVFLTAIFLLNVKPALLGVKAKVPSSPGLNKDSVLQKKYWFDDAINNYFYNPIGIEPLANSIYLIFKKITYQLENTMNKKS